MTAPVVGRRIDTHCPYCGLQCAMALTADGASGPTVSARQFSTNRGGLCQKGWTSAELLRHPDRLTTPLVRVAGRLQPTSWDDALDRVADGFRAAQEVGGRDAVGIFGGGGLTNEKAYMLGKFARVALGTSNIDYNGRFCMSSAAAAGIRAFGLDRGLPFPVTDLTSAKAILLVGGNVAETMPPLVGHLTAAAEAGGLIVVDPRRTATADRALAGGGLHLQLAPGTDLPLALGMLHLAVTEGHLDREFVETRTTGFDDAWLAAAQWWPERTERVTGVPVAALRRAVEVLARSRRADTGAYVLTARGTEQHASGTDTVSAWIGLALALGLPGRRGSGYGPVTGQGNGQGGREHGQKADQLPGYRKISDPVAREHVARVWGVDPADLPGPGRSAYELLDVLGRPGGPRALMVHGANLAVSAPGRARRRPVALPRSAGGVRLPAVGDRRDGRRGAAGPAVGRGGGHDDEPRGACIAAASGCGTTGRSSRRARSAAWVGRSARAACAPVPGRAARGVRRAEGRIRRWRRGLCGRHLRPSRCGGGAALAVSRRRASRDAPAVPRPLRHRRREGSVHRRRASGSGRSAGRGVPTGRDHGTCSRALSIGRADPPGRGAGVRGRVDVRPGAPGHRGTGGSARRGRRARRRAPRPSVRHGAVRRLDAPRHGVPAVPLRRRRPRQPAHQPGTRSDEPDAGVQGVRGAAGAGRAVAP
ncbi:molybdopterin-dependent oxidoreductase [Rhodococcus hoagii]|nr:molybdopterin-dependent oxidoreductase [Prescottella equi]